MVSGPRHHKREKCFPFALFINIKFFFIMISEKQMSAVDRTLAFLQGKTLSKSLGSTGSGTQYIDGEVVTIISDGENPILGQEFEGTYYIAYPTNKGSISETSLFGPFAYLPKGKEANAPEVPWRALHPKTSQAAIAGAYEVVQRELNGELKSIKLFNKNIKLTARVHEPGTVWVPKPGAQSVVKNGVKMPSLILNDKAFVSFE